MFGELVARYTVDLSVSTGDDVVTELCATRWSTAGGWRTRAEEKAEVRKRLGASPVDNDAILLTWYQPATTWRWASY